MPNQLYLRFYTRQRHGHAHDFHQLVLPRHASTPLPWGWWEYCWR
ncbi:hypothetical protein [Oceanisphaera ostreae]|uniref:Uncharacterized protein n=1 Tax=Oceanisphaera ostreae TaxID=914151 RepID=A0ABW3KEN9_9GAMM